LEPEDADVTLVALLCTTFHRWQGSHIVGKADRWVKMGWLLRMYQGSIACNAV